MIYLSAILVVLAFGLLVAGVWTGTAVLVMWSIVVSVLSALFLMIGALLRRHELFPSGGTPAAMVPPMPPAGAGVAGGAMGHPGATASPMVLPRGPSSPLARPLAAPHAPHQTATLAPPRAFPASGSARGPAVAGGAPTSGDIVLVIPGRKRFHLPTCRQLAGRQTEELTYEEAREEGFTACTTCLPDGYKPAVEDKPQAAFRSEPDRPQQGARPLVSGTVSGSARPSETGKRTAAGRAETTPEADRTSASGRTAEAGKASMSGGTGNASMSAGTGNASASAGTGKASASGGTGKASASARTAEADKASTSGGTAGTDKTPPGRTAEAGTTSERGRAGKAGYSSDETRPISAVPAESAMDPVERSPGRAGAPIGSASPSAPSSPRKPDEWFATRGSASSTDKTGKPDKSDKPATSGEGKAGPDPAASSLPPEVAASLKPPVLPEAVSPFQAFKRPDPPAPAGTGAPSGGKSVSSPAPPARSHDDDDDPVVVVSRVPRTAVVPGKPGDGGKAGDRGKAPAAGKTADHPKSTESAKTRESAEKAEPVKKADPVKDDGAAKSAVAGKPGGAAESGVAGKSQEAAKSAVAGRSGEAGKSTAAGASAEPVSSGETVKVAWPAAATPKPDQDAGKPSKPAPGASDEEADRDGTSSDDGDKPKKAGPTVERMRPGIVKVIPGTRRYHSSACPLIKGSDPDTLETMSKADADAAGLTHCSVCDRED